MKHLFLTAFLLLLLLPVQSFGQNEWTTVLDEKFSNNNFGWTEGTESDYVFKVKAGRYTLENKSTGTMYRSMNQIELDYQKDYIIQADLRFVRGDDNRGFGIYFGGDSEQYIFFSITANGYYSFMKYTSQWTDLISWTESEMIAQQASTNTVKIEKIGNTMSFYINDELVNTYATQSTFGKYLGFAINANMTWEADNLKIMERASGSNTTDVTTGSNKAWGFYDNFETNNNYWFETSEGGVTAKVSNGNYVINNNARSGETVYALMDVPRQYIKEFKDGYFVGTAKIKVVHSGNAQAGVALGDPDHVMYVFGITKGGKYFCNIVENGQTSSLISPTNSSAIKQGVNALSMWVYNNTLTLMINEVSVTEALPVSPLVSYLFGLSVAKGANIEVDDIGSLLGDPNAEDIVFGDGTENPVNNDNKVTSKDPYKEGLEIFKTGEYANAIPYFTQALEADPDHYDALYYRSIAYGAISESQKALNDIQTLLDKNNDYEGALLARGVFYIDLDRFAEAYADFNKIIDTNPNGRADAYYYRGFAKVKEGKTTSACKDLRRAKELQTTFDVDSMLEKHCK